MPKPQYPKTCTVNLQRNLWRVFRVTLLEEKEETLIKTFTAIRDGIVEYLGSDN